MTQTALAIPERRTGWHRRATDAAAVPSARPRADYADRKRALHNQLIDTLNVSAVTQLTEERRRIELKPPIERLLDAEPSLCAPAERDQMVAELLDEILGLGPLEPLMNDPTISDILVNGPNEVYVDRKGALELTDIHFRDNDHVMQVLDRIVSRIGRRVDESSPMVDARLLDGSRVNAVIPPLALKGPTISIRRFGKRPLTLDDLLRFKMLTPEMAEFFAGVIKARMNIIISGGTGSGKTTLLNALSRFIPDHERVVTIEDAAELQLQQRHVVPLETRPPNIEGKGEVTTRDLVRNCLRMRPDRIVVGECRSGEALDMLQAMNTGHDGSLTTLHANKPRDALARLETMILMTGLDMPVKAMRQQIASAIDLIIQVSRLQGGVRRITCVAELTGMEGDVIVLQDIFEYQQLGVGKKGNAFGVFCATGVRPKFMARLETANMHLPKELFGERVLLSDS